MVNHNYFLSINPEFRTVEFLPEVLFTPYPKPPVVKAPPFTALDSYDPYTPLLFISVSLVTVTLLFLIASNYVSAIVSFSAISELISFYYLNFLFHNSTSPYKVIIYYSDDE